MSRSQKIIVILLLVLLIGGGAALWLVAGDTHRRIDELSRQVEQTREDILGAMLAEKVEQLTKGISGDQERCLRIAAWIAGHISNQDDSFATMDVLATRAGLCYGRARLFVKMLSYLSIEARVFVMYNFGGPGGGHTCAQAFYDKAWHFFDLMYAGVFMQGGVVLSWREIKADPASSLKHMKPFPHTLDRNGQISDDPTTRSRVDNTQRMAEAYSIRSIGQARSYGFWARPPAKTLYPVIDCNKLGHGLRLGGESHRKLNADGIQKGASERLGDSLRTVNDFFHTQWQLINCTPGREITLRYTLGKVREGSALHFWAKTKGAEIVEGATRDIGWRDRWFGGQWEIVIMPSRTSCTLLVGHDFTKLGMGVDVKGIEITMGDRP